MCKLPADRRWLLTGTPVQNSLEDLAPFFEFLRAYPFDNKKTFLAEIVKPLMTGQDGGLGRLKALMGAITLRRTKHLLHLPSAQRMIRTLVFSPAEKRAYDAAMQEAKEGINAAISNQGTISVMQILTKLRRICNHGLQEPKTKINVTQLTQSWNSGTAQEAFLAMLDNDTAVCSECGRDLGQISAEEIHSSHYHELFKCLHLKCDQCLAKVSGGEKENKGCPHDPKCQSHQVRHPPSETLPTERSRPDSPNGLDIDKVSTKIKVLADDIGRDRRGEKR
jgi:SWI/SNF-related matrix-associated actin-dependent regulator of chromatin subfamily A3